jgi:hypothetical protein
MCIENNSWDEIKRRIDYNLTIKAKNALFVLQQKLLKNAVFRVINVVIVGVLNVTQIFLRKYGCVCMPVLSLFIRNRMP